jgi:hypothetical protein
MNYFSLNEAIKLSQSLCLYCDRPLKGVPKDWNKYRDLNPIDKYCDNCCKIHKFFNWTSRYETSIWLIPIHGSDFDVALRISHAAQLACNNMVVNREWYKISRDSPYQPWNLK